MKKYCKDCKQNVTPFKRFSVGLLLIVLAAGLFAGFIGILIGGAVVALMHGAKVANICPKCKGSDLVEAVADEKPTEKEEGAQ